MKKTMSTAAPDAVESENEEDLLDVLEHLEQAAERLRVPPIGALVDARYRVLENIGCGTTGWIFVVRHQFLDQCFAMKILHPRIASDPAWIARFREEARATSLIAHDNIVFVTDFGYCKTFGHYLVMEYLDGQGLDTILEDDTPLPFDMIVRFAQAAGNALHAIHSLGIIYANLNPRNVMMVPGELDCETWKLLDFSTASFRTEAALDQIEFGSPAYLSPEQAGGEHLDPRSDIFSLAVILYEMLTGQLPWEVESRNGATREERQHAPKAPSQVCAATPEDLDPILLRALELERDKRWKTVAEFIAAVNASVRSSLEMDTEPLATFSHSLAEPIEMEDDPATDWISGSQVRVSYLSPEKLTREYLRNLQAGKLYVASKPTTSVDETLSLRLHYAPSGVEVGVRVSVVTSADNLDGIGLVIPVSERSLIETFVRNLHLGLGVQQDDVLRPLVELDEQSDLTVGEAFLLSRVTQATRVGEARSLCAGLPFQFEHAVAGLVQKGHFSISGANTGTWRAIAREPQADASLSSHKDEQAHPALNLDDAEVEKTLDLVESLRQKKNYLSAIDVLRKALGVAPETAEFYYQLALLYAQFTNDLPRAFQSLYNAIRLSPDNAVYRDTLEVFERMKF